MEWGFKNRTYYKSTAVIFSPYGIIKEGTVMVSEKWRKALVYGIGNCGIDAMFEIAVKPPKQ